MSLTVFAAASLCIEAESRRSESALLGIPSTGKHRSDLVERSCISRRITARSSTDRRLIDHDHLIDLTDPSQTGKASWFGCQTPQAPDESVSESFIHQSTFSGATDTRHANQASQRNLDGNVFQVIR